MDGDAIRSLLFSPGDSESKVLKALASDADAVIVDLEDAVAPEAKATARLRTRELLIHADRRGKPLFVRVNAFDSGLTAIDLAAVMPGRPWAVVLPKCGPNEVQQLSHYLDALEAREGIEVGTTRILTIATETVTGTLALGSATPAPSARLWGLIWGGEDLAAALGARVNRDERGEYTFPYQFARSQCLYAANGYGAHAVDAVYADYRDLAGLERETREGLRDGFTAKAAIHPAQCAVINRVLTPSDGELRWAREVVALLADVGVGRLDGKMIDLAHKRIAVRLLQRAATLGGGAPECK